MEEDNNVIQKLTLSKEGAEDLTFFRCDSEEIPEGYVPVTLPESSKEELMNAFSAAIGVAVPSAIFSQAANGLYRATADPALLMTFADGVKKGTAIMKGGKIIGHAGFKPVSPKVFTPLLIFQVLSFFTGQYYMHGISKQLEALQESINELKKDLEIEKQTTLSAAYDELKSLFESSINTVDDLSLIQQIKYEMSKLYHFYLLKIQDSNDRFIEEMKKKTSPVTGGWLSIYNISFAKVLRDQLSYLKRMFLDAYRLHIISTLVYLKALASVCTDHKEYTPKIGDILNSLDKYNIDFIEKLSDSCQKRLSQILNEPSLLWGNSESLYYKMNKSRNNKIIEEFQAINDEWLKSMKSEIDAILQPINTKQVLLLSIKDGEPRLYRLEKPE